MAFKQRTYTEVPHDETLSPQIREFLASLLSQVNALSGQGTPTTGQGIQALSLNTIDPTTGQITSAGNRVSSVTTALTFTATSTSAGSASITFFWDGNPINGSQAFKIGRDDGSVYGPNPAGSPFVVSGLSANTLYFFYPYFDEGLQRIVFASVPGKSLGTPPVAFTAQNFKAAQQQIMRRHIALALSLSSTGISTPPAPASGQTTTSPASGGVGGAATGAALAASNLTNGVTGSGAVVLATSPTLGGTILSGTTLNTGSISGGTIVAAGNGGGSSAGLQVVASNAGLSLSNDSQPADGKVWDFATSGSTLLARAINDANNSSSPWATVTRSGFNITSLQLYATPLQLGGADTGLSRTAAATLAVGNGTGGDASGTLKATTVNAVNGFQVNGTAIAASNLSNGTTGSGGVVLASGPSLITPSITSPTTTGADNGNQTLTNKRITPRVLSLPDGTSFTPSSDTADINTHVNTQAAGTLTANAPSGTPTEGQSLALRIKSANVQNYAWNAIFRGSATSPLPTSTTGGGKTDYITFIFNGADSKWDCVAVNMGH